MSVELTIETYLKELALPHKEELIRDILLFLEKEIKTESIYRAIRVPHIVISISGVDDQETLVPTNQYRQGLLHLKFDDVSDSKSS